MNAEFLQKIGINDKEIGENYLIFVNKNGIIKVGCANNN